VIRDFEANGDEIASFSSYSEFVSRLIPESESSDTNSFIDDSSLYKVTVPDNCEFKGLKKNETLELLLSRFNGEKAFCGVVALYLKEFCNKEIQVVPNPPYLFSDLKEQQEKSKTIGQVMGIVKKFTNKELKELENHIKFLEENDITVELEQDQNEFLKDKIKMPHNAHFE